MNEQDAEIPPAPTKRLIFNEPIKGDLPLVAPEIGPRPEDLTLVMASGASDHDDRSVEELQREQEEITRRIQEKQEAEKKAVIEQIVTVANTYKISAEELVDALGGIKIKRKGVKAVQKYQDPQSGQTWSGRGKEPTWIRGKDRTKFLIP